MIKKIMKYIFNIIFIVTLILNYFVTFSFCAENSRKKGDLDSDNEITINDLAILKLHLIGKTQIPEEKKYNADLDNDNEITINDLARMKLVLIGLLELEDEDEDKDEEITVDDTSFTGYTFDQITPDNREVTYEYYKMATSYMVDKGIYGDGAQWPVSMESSKDGNLMLYGTDCAGIYKSTDHGQTWEMANTGLTCRGAGMFAIDPYNNNHVIVLGISQSTKRPYNGIYVTFDGTDTWEQVNFLGVFSQRYHYDGLEFDPTSYDDNKNMATDIYFSTPYLRDTWGKEDATKQEECKSFLDKETEVGLYRSTDCGKSFEIVNHDIRLSDGMVKITDDGKLYIGNEYGLFLINKETFQIEKSYLENNIEEHTTINEKEILNFNMGITGLDCIGNKLYIQTWEGIYTLENDKLEKIESDNYPNIWPQYLKVSKSNPNYMLIEAKRAINNYYTNYLYYSKDGGKTWNKANADLDSFFLVRQWNNIERIFVIDPTNENRVLTTGNGSISISNDGGENFIQANGLSNLMCGGKINLNYYNPDLMILGGQDFGGGITRDGGLTWERNCPLLSTNEIANNLYGAFAADPNTIFGWVTLRENSGYTLQISFDGGKSWHDTGLTSNLVKNYAYSSLQSYNNPDILFSNEYYSKDRGKTWNKMNGCIGVYTINYLGQHELYGANENGNLVVSYDDGDTWKILYDKKMYDNYLVVKENIIDIAYDHVNNIVYMVDFITTSSNTTGSRVIKLDLKTMEKKVLNIPNPSGTGAVRSVAVDPNSTSVVYVAGSGDMCSSPTAFQRSIDGGETFVSLTSSRFKKSDGTIVETKATNQGGYEAIAIRVNQINGRVIIGTNCFGFESINPPYDIEKLNHKAPSEHTVKYVYNGKVIHESKVKNGAKHNYKYETEGLEFIDWYIDKEYKNSFSNGTNVYNSIVLYAKMQESKKIELYSEGKIFKTVDLDKFDAGNEELIPTREGYAFAGWFKDETLTESIDLRKVTEDTKAYAGWYKVGENIFDVNSKDLSTYISYSEQKITYIDLVSNEENADNRSAYLDVDKNSSYLVTLKMDNRFRIGMSRNRVWVNQKISNYYIDEDDQNLTTGINKFVYKKVDTGDYNKLLIFYYTSIGTKEFMEIKNTIKVYKIEDENLVY